MRRVASYAFFVFTFASSVFAQTDLPKFFANVKVEVTAQPTALREQVESYLKRELRSLPDVNVVSEDQHWLLSIIVLQTEDLTGVRGYNFSIVVLQPSPSALLTTLLLANGKISAETSKSLLDWTTGLVRFLDHRIYTGDQNSLRSRCEKIVADFDTSQLEPTRDRKSVV